MKPAGGTRLSDLTRRSALAAFAGAATLPLAARAQGVPAGFPQKAMTIVVPFSAGGPVDVLGRLLAQEYQARSGHTVTVENKTGGAGNIGIDYVKKSVPDGTTLLVIPAGNLTINPTLMSNLSFNVEQDFAPIALLASAPNVIVAAPKLGVTTTAQLVAKAKAMKISYGSPGVGSQLHLTMELFGEKAGAQFLHVPYRGSTQALNDLLGDHIDLVATNLTAAVPLIQAKTAIPIAVTGATRATLLPDVPTLSESGFTGIDVTSWYGLLGPRALSQIAQNALFSATEDILTSTPMRERLSVQGLTVTIEPPSVFAARITRETASWAEVIKNHKIQAQ